MEKLETIAKEMVELSVSEAKELLTILDVEHGIKYHEALLPVMDTTEEVEVVQTTFDVIIEAAGGRKLKVVKVVKDLIGLPLKEAMTLVNSAPAVFAEGVDEKLANEYERKLTEMGATISIK